MTTSRIFAGALACGLIAAGPAYAQPLLSFKCQNGQVVLAPEPQLRVINNTNQGADCAMWQTFIYLNWPARPGSRGVPDPSAKFGGPGATVWETYKTVDQVFLPDGIKPAPWNQDAVNSALPENIAADAAAGKVRALTRTSKVSRTVAARIDPASAPDAATQTMLKDIQQADQNVLYDQQKVPVFYEIAMSKIQFDYIVNNGLYNANTQLAYAQKSNIVPPFGSVEVKTAWKVLTPAEVQSGRFHTMPAYIPSLPQPQATVGLVGFHINVGGAPQKKGNAYTIGIWGTFAHVDNAPLASQLGQGPYNFYNPDCTAITACAPNNAQTNPTQVVQNFADDSQADGVNKLAQAMIKRYDANSPWQHYKLINAQWSPRGIPVSTPAKVPLQLGIPSTMRLMNPVLETFMQTNGTNCAGCHANASTAINSNIAAGFSFMFLNAQSKAK